MTEAIQKATTPISFTPGIYAELVQQASCIAADVGPSEPSATALPSPLYPLGKMATEKDVSNLGRDLIKRFDFDASKIVLNTIFQDVSNINLSRRNLLLMQTWDLWDRCLQVIPSTLAKLNVSLFEKAYVATKLRTDYCAPSCRDAIRDPFYKIVPLSKETFEYFVGYHADTTLDRDGTTAPDESKISELLIDASQKYPQTREDWVVKTIGATESSIDQFGNFLSCMGETASDRIAQSFIDQGFNATGRVVNQAGRVLSQKIGQSINAYPTSSPLMAGLCFPLYDFLTLTQVLFGKPIHPLDIGVRSTGNVMAGYFTPHAFAGGYNLLAAGHNKLAETLVNLNQMASDPYTYTVDSVSGHPWIAGTGVATFFGTWFGSYVHDKKTKDIFFEMGHCEWLRYTTTLIMKAGIAASGVMGLGSLGNAAFGSYQKDDGYNGSLAKETGNA